MQRVGIIGGGPAGLAAAQALHHAGVEFRLFEEGAPLAEREHDRAEQLGIGIGGAGLFSDGKFSFYPSGTHLYRLGDGAALRDSYRIIAAQLDAVGIDAPAFPDVAEETAVSGGFQAKDYSSSYGTLEQRIRLTDALSAGCEASLYSFCTVTDLRRTGQGYRIGYRKGRHGPPVAEEFDAVVLASGRFGGIGLGPLSDDAFPVEELRYEVGVRIEHPNRLGFLRHSKKPDVKFILNQAETEVRTFCTCRDGEVWMIPYDGVSALSGRSDGPPSGYSNFGLLPRFTGGQRAVGGEIWSHYIEACRNAGSALWQPLPEFLGVAAGQTEALAPDRPWNPREDFVRGDIAAALHTVLAETLKRSLRAIVERFPDMLSPETICLFPAIEGAGRFPPTDADLKMPDEMIWCCGDVVGRFRGLIPALVSGHYAGVAAARRLAVEKERSAPARVLA